MRKRVSRWQATLAAVVIWGGIFCANVLADEGPDASPVNPATHNISEFLTPDGRFNLEAARLSGFEGSLDLDDVDLQFDPRTGEPRVRPSTAASLTDDPDDIYWDNSISSAFPGVDGTVYAMTVYDGKLIIGGHFWVAGGTTAQNIVAWDGNSWSSLGSWNSEEADLAAVRSLTVYDGKLIVGGTFIITFNDIYGYEETAEGIAAWDGSNWSTLGYGFEGEVFAMTVYNGNLIVGGYVKCNSVRFQICVVSWNGFDWNSLGIITSTDIYFPMVYSLAVYDGKLFVGGDFNTVAGIPVSNLASWDGSSWSPVATGASGPNDWVCTMIVYNGKLVMGGRLWTNGKDAPYLASWDGSSWEPMGLWVGGRVSALTIFRDKLIAGGSFTTAGGVPADNVASWDGNSWSPLGSGTNGTVQAAMGYEDKLIAGGYFTIAGDVGAVSIASWDGISWTSTSMGLNGFVYSLTVYDGKLIMGGSFTAAGGVAASGIASWDGVAWSALGSGTNNVVLTMTVYNGKLYAAGEFTEAGGSPASYVASWDGIGWSPLGAGTNDVVCALTVYDDKLVAAGKYTSAGEVAANRIASWDGNSWSTLGLGMNNVIEALTVYDGKLIAGGRFGNAGGVAVNFIASWNGTSWSPLGSGISEYVYALTVYDQKLVASGEFWSAGGVQATNIASWDGSSWSALGPGLIFGDYTLVGSLTVYDGKLVAGGRFTYADVPVNYIASWDGSKWSPLGSGMSGGPSWPWIDVFAFAEFDGRLVAGGSFTIAGDKACSYLATWTKRCCEGRVGDANGEGEYPDEVTLGDIMLLVDALFISSDCGLLPCVAEADVNQDGGADPSCEDHVTLGDIMILVDFLFIHPETAVLPDCL